MKLINHFFTVTICLLLLSFASCSKDDSENKKLTLTIASEKIMFFDGFGGYFFAKEEGSDKWIPFDNISGFEYEEGYEYVLNVWQEKWHNGEIADAGIYRYKLLNVISKTKKDSENIPLQKSFVVIASKKTTDPNNPYYIMKENKWVPFPTIEGFEYTEGYEYTILMDIRFNGSNATNKYTYTHIETGKKELRNSANLPE